MMKIVILLLTLMLSGCSMMPKLTSAKPKFPEPFVDNATQKMPQCEDLKQIPADVNNLSEVFKVIVDNYTLYWKCSNQVDGWNEWYNEQKKIYDSK
jgi:PBP1b-binding outer membrane lipoprotein LpoB